ncbi:MAG: HlyD family secretion protein [Myxococcota bacterium]|nr:HlyD family secretion protein [Myxococcota bacterium]
MATSTMDAAARNALAPAASPKQKSRKTLMIMASVGVVATIVGTTYYVRRRGLETTDDSQVDADIVSVPARTSSTVVAVHFIENQTIKAGALLVELDAEPAKARLAQAEANLEAAKANADAADAEAEVAGTNAVGNKSVAQAQVQGAASSASATKPQIAEAEAQVVSAQVKLDQAKADRDRAEALVASGSISTAELERNATAFESSQATLIEAKARLAAMKASTEQAWSQVQAAGAKLKQVNDVDVLVRQARAKAQSARAQVATAQAVRDLAALDLAYTNIVAPSDGIVSRKTVVVGQMLAPGQGVVQLVPTQREWITGNFKETQLANMRVGQKAEVAIDAYPGDKLHGEVESFSAATGARFSLLPPDNATGNFTKVVQRVPVRIRLRDVPESLALRPGMSATVTVDTGH